MIPNNIRSDFPVLANAPELVYFDSASSSLLPKACVDAVTSFLSTTVVSSRRGAHKLTVAASNMVESVRLRVATFTKTHPSQISFQPSIPCAVTSLVYGYDWKEKKKSRILLSQNEEHDIYVSLIRAAKGLHLDVDIIPINERGAIDVNSVSELMTPETGIVAVGLVAPGTGNRNPVKEIRSIVDDADTILLCDATRGIGFFENEFASIGADIVLCNANIGLLGPPGLAIQ